MAALPGSKAQLASPPELQSLYAEINAQDFAGILPPCRLTWSARLTRTAGNIDVRRRLIKLSVPLLADAYQSDSLFPPSYDICGVACESRERALREILRHEMIHLWLFVQGKPHNHTAEFRARARAMGQPKIRHDIALPAPTSGWVYTCPQCGNASTRRRRFSRPVACAHCCKRFSKGRFDARFKLRGSRVVAGG